MFLSFFQVKYDQWCFLTLIKWLEFISVSSHSTLALNFHWKTAVYHSNACDVMWFLTRHHFENLDSVNSRGSSLDKYPIRTIRSQSRPRSISSSESSKRSLFIKWGSANLLPKSYYHYWQKAIKNRAQLWRTEYSRQLADNNKGLLAFHGRRKIISHGSRKSLERNKSALMAYRSHIVRLCRDLSGRNEF